MYFFAEVSLICVFDHDKELNVPFQTEKLRIVLIFFHETKEQGFFFQPHSQKWLKY